jgi:hypothetical protein
MPEFVLPAEADRCPHCGEVLYYPPICCLAAIDEAQADQPQRKVLSLREAVRPIVEQFRKEMQFFEDDFPSDDMVNFEPCWPLTYGDYRNLLAAYDATAPATTAPVPETGTGLRPELFDPAL